MNRTCGNCRWWVLRKDAPDAGECRRHSPKSSARHDDERWSTTWMTDFCGEWADAATTPEQDERRELVRRFAIGLTSGAVYESSIDPTVKAVWMIAQAMADAEPDLVTKQIS